MFDINKIINDTSAAAVSTHITTLQQEYANKMAEMADKITALETRIAALEHAATQPLALNKEELLEHLDNQEWFWGKIRHFTDGAVEQAMDMHIETYDHDNYDNAVSALGGIDFDDFVKREDFRSEIEDVLNDATIKFRF